METKTRALIFNNEEHEALKKSVMDRGIIFEEEIEKDLTEHFDANWNVLSSVCFREQGMDTELDGRSEIDFLVKRSAPLFQKDLDFSTRGLDLDFLNPHLLIEAKFSSFDWCFFDLKSEREKKKGAFSFFTQKEEDQKAFFIQKPYDILKLKRALPLRTEEKKVVLGRGNKVEIPAQDLIRKGVRQIVKNMQMYMRQELETEKGSKTLLPILVTNAPLVVFSDLFENPHQINLRNCFEYPYVCFELDDFLFWKGEKVLTRIWDSNRGFCSKNLSKVHVWIVNARYLIPLIRILIPDIKDSVKR